LLGLVWVSETALAFPISVTIFKTDSIKFITIGDYHEESENDEHYAKIIQKFLEDERQKGKRSVVQIEHNIRSNIEDYKEGSYLRLLQEYNHSKPETWMINVIPVDQRRSGSPIKLLHILQLMRSLTRMSEIFHSEAMQTIETGAPRLKAVENPREVVASIERELSKAIFSEETQSRFAEQFGLKITLESLLTDLMTQTAALDDELMGKYKEGSLIYSYLLNCITSLLENVPALESYFQEYLPLEEALQTPLIDFVFNAMRQKQDLAAIALLVNAITKSLEFEGDAYLASAAWDLLHSDNKPHIIILVGGGRHIENINPLFENLLGKPSSHLSLDPEGVKMMPDQLDKLLR